MKNLFLTFATVLPLLGASAAGYGAITFSIAGSGSSSHVTTLKHDSSAATASFAVDLGRYFRIGMSHRQKTEVEKGYKDISGQNDDAVWAEYYSKTNETTNSLDLTLVLYHGQIITPYIFVGMASKSYMVSSVTDGVGRSAPFIPPPTPTSGAGFGLRINRQFSIKFSHTLTPSYIIDPVNETAAGTIDSYSQVGVSYRL